MKNPTHIHKETGGLYRLLFITNEDATKDKFVVTAVYLGGDGSLWSRPLVEFNDRFEEIDK